MKFLRVAFYAILWVFIPLGADEPIAIYLTWTQDPTSTMVVQWLTPIGAASQLGYHSRGESSWISAKSQSETVEDCTVHRVYLEGLKEDSEYVFKVQDSKREYRFRTMPKKLTRPVRFVIGGDAYYTSGAEVFHRMNRVIAFNKPDFVVVGGDLAYTTGTKHLLKGPKWALTRWQAFLRDLQKLGQDGQLIPLLPILGNHDITKPKNKPPAVEMFYQIFTFPEANKAYRSLDFGNYLSLVMLDTGHTWPIEGDQTAWLEKTLQEKQSVPYVLTAYHMAAYPSYYASTGINEVLIRKNWVPLFEKYHVPFAFEHHNHTFKRTHPLKDGKINPHGVTYLGDGSWGVPTRPVKSPEELWYLAKSASVNSCYIVTLTEEKCLIEAKNIQGEVIDQIEKVNASTASLVPVSIGG